MIRFGIPLIVINLALFPNSGAAETLEAFLKRLDLTEVVFEGHIRYDPTSLNDIPFVYYDADGQAFPVTMDAGRKTREIVEDKCESDGFMVNKRDLCQIKGTGSVEIRGSRVHLSVDSIESLTPPE
ncbi:hypothetical protein [Shimia abyssi]|uniref:Uncharacterized protein n=1 Tax=Shimia abyssi TaxID=1662395 RepID=A0A2P8FET2_9RHOB|nr:hypothetical protein [Shimia abyssi]PSL20232.1 hypothetical protein CLV88_104293 [Shimia abyssi]